MRRLEANHIAELDSVRKVEQEKVNSLDRRLSEVDEQYRKLGSEMTAQSKVLSETTQSNSTWYLSNIYGPCSGEARNEFVEWLYELQISDNESWLLIGDCNFYRSPTDRNKEGGNIDDMFTFNNIIRSHNLVDLPLTGATYTWSNMQSDPLLERLD
jgi:hypothetical protein